MIFFFFSSRRRHTRFDCDWSSDVCSSDLNLKILTVADLIRYRMQHERYVHRIAEAVLPTRFGEFRMIAYSSDVDRDQHVALVRGNLEGPAPIVRVHSHCLTGDVLGSTACDCSDLIALSLEAIAREDRGVFLYLHH